ncbi:2OG-Fe dioxygenase family protein [Vibrio chagasii]|nr:2OG-Fe dioxygenase family protein [Vibrio chagasii]
MQEMCELFIETNGLEDRTRNRNPPNSYRCHFEERAQVAPEGVHQDGFDHIALIGVNRHNIVGGEIMLYQDSHEAPFFRKVLEDGEVAMLADSKLWHNFYNQFAP